jgi:hypothetical protein
VAPWISYSTSRWAAVIAVFLQLGSASTVHGQREPCANFVGAGRIPYCGGKPGIYAVVDAVGFEPSDGRPERIRISGTFVIAGRVYGGTHLAPQRGQLYFSMVPEREVAVRKDWSDLAAAAGTGRVVGFTEYWVSRPMGPGDLPYDRGVRGGTMNSEVVVSIHKAGDLANPEPYPLPHELGVLQSFDRPEDSRPRFGPASAEIIAALREAARR